VNTRVQCLRRYIIRTIYHVADSDERNVTSGKVKAGAGAWLALDTVLKRIKRFPVIR
jgi:hypothetical protein